MTACDDCLRRAWLVAMLGGHLERGRRRPEVLTLDDEALIEAYAGGERAQIFRRHAQFDPGRARQAVEAAGLATRCPHGSGFPARLRELPDVPAAMFVAGRVAAFDALCAEDAPAVSVVGARRSAGEGEEVAAALAHGLAAAGVCVVSGLALGIDSAAHRGALAAPWRGTPPLCPTVAVLAGGADVVYPPSASGLYRRVVASGCVVSEQPPGATPRRWSFPARNRIIAALGAMTVVVQARERSGSLITADLATQLGRTVGAVPGPVTRPLSHGTNALLADGAVVVRDARDALDVVLPGWRSIAPPEQAVPVDLDPELQEVLRAVQEGALGPGQLAGPARTAAEAAGALTRLELLGLVRRDAAGRYAPAVL